MTCFRPNQGYYSDSFTKSGKRKITFKFQEACVSTPMLLPCGQCVGCRLDRSRVWAIRCLHEAQMHDRNCFITLTYDDDHLPSDMSLNYKHFQYFMKRFREKCGNGIKFYMCGEYGEKFGRPHYHACIFGFDFDDRVLWRNGEFPLYRSDTLESLWKFGFSTIGNVTFESAAYVARYIMKKVTGPSAFHNYFGPETHLTGALREPEFTRMSRNPGIGSIWFDEYCGDVFPLDEVVIRGRKMRPPKYYDYLFEKFSFGQFDEIKEKRVVDAVKLNPFDKTQRRLYDAEIVKLSQISTLRRGLDLEI